MSIPLLGQVIPREGVQPYPKKSSIDRHASAKEGAKKELQAFLAIINYLGKFSSGTTNVCDPLCKLTSSKVTWAWNVSYQALFNRAKLLIKVDM